MQHSLFFFSCIQFFYEIHDVQGFTKSFMLERAFVPNRWALRSLEKSLAGRKDENGAGDEDGFAASVRNHEDDDDASTRNELPTDCFADEGIPLLSDLAESTSSEPLRNLQSIDEKVLQPLEKTLDPFWIEEIEAMGGDPFFLSGEYSDELRVDTDNVDLKNLSFEMLGEIATASSGFMNGIGGVRSLRSSNEVLKTQKMRQTENEFNILDAMATDPSFLSQTFYTSDETQRQVDELLTLGGDPFFLSDNNDYRRDSETEDQAYEELMAIGGDPLFISVKDKDYHLMETTNTSPTSYGTKRTKDKNLSQMEILSQIAALSIDEDAGFSAVSLFQSLGNIATDDQDGLPSDENILDEIEAIGGDPFFLDQPEVPKTSMTIAKTLPSNPSGMRYVTDGLGPTPQVESSITTEHEEWEWDGTVDEDAHIDVA